MNQTMNEMCKKDLPNLYEWCEEYAKKTGVKIYAANPPLGLVVEDLMGKLNTIAEKLQSLASACGDTFAAYEIQINAINEQLNKEPEKKEKAKK